MSHWYKNFTYEISIDTEDGGEKIYVAEIEAHIVHDPNYGADADGHRGIAITEIDDWELKSLIEKDSRKDVECTDEIEQKINDRLDDEDDLSEDIDYDPKED